MSFAESTTVPVEKSKAELDGLLARAGAAQRTIGVDDAAGTAVVVFAVGKDAARRMVRLTIPLPKLEDFQTDRKPPRMTVEQWRAKAHEQGCRSRWRAMVLLVKAKLEAVALGVSTLEREFHADILLGDGRTVGQALQEQLAKVYLDGNGPLMLGMGERQ